jgi:hypothetical protein
VRCGAQPEQVFGLSELATPISASHANKAAVKPNPRAMLIKVWPTLRIASIFLNPSLSRLIDHANSAADYWHDVGLSWLALGVGCLHLTKMQLFALQGPVLGPVLATMRHPIKRTTLPLTVASPLKCRTAIFSIRLSQAPAIHHSLHRAASRR